MNTNFIFPCTKFAMTYTEEEQLAHLFSEVKEAFEEIQKGNTVAALREITDVVHSFETLRRIVPDRTNALIYYTITKNSARGYYTNHQGSQQDCRRCGCGVFRNGRCVSCKEDIVKR